MQVYSAEYETAIGSVTTFGGDRYQHCHRQIFSTCRSQQRAVMYMGKGIAIYMPPSASTGLTQQSTKGRTHDLLAFQFK